MKVIILLSSMALVSAAQLDPPPRSVKVALETSFLFDPIDITDESFVNNIKGFLDKLYKILEPAQNQSHFRAEAELQGNEGSPNFIEIIRNVGTHFVNMSGGKIKEALDNIHGEVVKIADEKKEQAKIKEIISDESMKAVTKNSEEMRRKINSIMTEDSPLLEKFARRVNTYYNDEDVKIIDNILKKFRRNVENVVDNSKVITELLHNAIFKKFNSLNESAKGALLSDLKIVSGFLIAKNMFSGLNENVLTRRNSPIQEDDTASFNEADMTYTALRRSIDKKLREAREKKAKKDKEEKKNGVGSGIVVDNVGAVVEPPKTLVKRLI